MDGGKACRLCLLQTVEVRERHTCLLDGGIQFKPKPPLPAQLLSLQDVVVAAKWSK